MKTHSTPEHDFLKSKHKNGGKKKNENKGVSQSFRANLAEGNDEYCVRDF